MKKLREISREISLMGHTNALLGWDQETYMPSGAIEERSEQMAFIEGLMHRKIISQEVSDLLDEASGFNDLSDVEKDFIRELQRDAEKSRKLPTELVEKLARTSSRSQAAWAQARQDNDYPAFKGHLAEILKLVKEKAEALGYEKCPYDALLDEFEPGLTSADLSKVFDEVGKELADFISEIRNRPQIDNSPLLRKWDKSAQEKLCNQVLGEMGFDFNMGRLDLSEHPFTTTLGFHDVRITTRYDENFFPMGLYGSIHEGGHALYEQGFGKELKFTHLATGTSLGIHESQSRMWENLIGRSRAFVDHTFPVIQKLFPETAMDLNSDMLYRALNRVEPSFIRVEADEVTYNLHIILRYTIEREMIEDGLTVDDLEERWNDLSEKLLGIRPVKASDGVLQDVHWSIGAIGYFPTYTLGNIYGSQFYAAMDNELGSVEDLVNDGNFSPILTWLRENIHQHGRRKDALSLCRDITGESINPRYFLDYVKKKFRGVYGS